MLDDYADHFVDLWELERRLREIASDFEEPHRSTLLAGIERLEAVIQEVNEKTDPTAASDGVAH